MFQVNITFFKPHKICLCVLYTYCILVCISTSYAQQYEVDSISIEIKKLKSKSSFTKKDTTYIKLLNDLAAKLRYINSDSILAISNEAYSLSDTLNYKHGKAKSLLNIANHYSDQGQINLAIQKYIKAAKFSDIEKDSKLDLRIKNNLATEYSYKGDFAKALELLLQGIELGTKYDNKLMLSILNENIASLYVSQNDFTEGLIYYKKVKKINEAIGDAVIIAETMSNMASVYADMGKLEYAMYNINSSITTFEKHKIMAWLAYAYEIKGKTYLKQHKFVWALHWYRQSEMIHKSIDDPRGEIDLLNGMAEAYFGLEKNEEAISFANQAYELSKQINFKEGKQKCANTLYKISKNNNDVSKALMYHEIYQKITDTLYKSGYNKSLEMLKTKVEYERQKDSWELEKEKAIAKQQNYIYVTAIFLLIFLAITLLVRRNARIQKKLNVALNAKTKDLEKREIELRAINETKDKLFSIIGHDLRGPIGAFQGLISLYREGDITTDEFLEHIPKLHRDIEHISFTLNNLLSWGQSQMNGLITKPSVNSIKALVNSNLNLLQETAYKKSIKLVNKITDNTMAYADPDQIDIVIRNLMSNALKFTPDNGMVSVDAEENHDHWVIKIEDTGIGMDEATCEAIFDNNATVTTYGTNNEKGTGLGLSLCKEMIEKNEGKIWVKSILFKGTTFYFTVKKTGATDAKNLKNAS